jgi:hypothetical protein
LPRKVFVAGEILTAADVNANLMDQAVMVFDSSAARGSAIPTPSEGMVTYLKNTDALEKYTTTWEPVDTGGLISVKSALKTDTFTASVTAGNNASVTGLSITHEVANVANKLIISAFFGVAGNGENVGNVGIAVHDGSALIGIGAAAGNRTRVSAGGRIAPSGQTEIVNSPAITFVHTPGAGSKTYTVRAINVADATQTLYINRANSDTDTTSRPRSVSSLVIQEVAV